MVAYLGGEHKGMLPKLTAEQARRRRAFSILHDTAIFVSAEIALAVYLVSGYVCDSFTIGWVINVLAFNYVAIVVLRNWGWITRRRKRSSK